MKLLNATGASETELAGIQDHLEVGFGTVMSVKVQLHG
jgi:hypothetical protein